MPLFVVGLNHRTAPVEVRETVAFANDTQREAVAALKAASAAEEVVLVSTCNRTEFYLRGADQDVALRAKAWLSQTPAARAFDLSTYLYQHESADVARHAFRVASGLDSMILGEPQILGQVKHAVKIANDAGALNGPLDRLFQDTFQIAKRVRTETAIGATSTSMAAAALKFAQQLFGDLRDCRVLLIGVGEMISLAATHFSQAKPKDMTVANRTIARGRELATQFNAKSMALNELPERLHEFDIVITSTASSLPIIGKGMVEAALKQRRRKPLFMVDLAVPRDIEAAVGELDDIFLYTLDSLGKVIQQNLASRTEAVKDAEVLIDQQATAFMQWLEARGSVPVIQQLRGKADHYRQIELARAQKMLAKGDDPAKVIEALALGLTNKFLHHPMNALKRVSPEERESLTDALEKLYPDNPDEQASE
jgi:glutamyl-tRNA reductase